MNKKRNIKVICDICNNVIFYSDAVKHLRSHGLTVFRVSEYTHKLNGTHRVHKSWYNPDAPKEPYPCGTKLSDGPKVKIIYNATESNRRKF